MGQLRLIRTGSRINLEIKGTVPDMFSIRLLPPSQCGLNGERLGEISINGFTERFACHQAEVTLDEMEISWRRQIRQVIESTSAVALVHDPRFAWIIYREGDKCFIQQKLSLDGNFRHLASRRTETEDGQAVSEWSTSVAELKQFVGGN
jgi:hypothetical protein